MPYPAGQDKLGPLARSSAHSRIKPTQDQAGSREPRGGCEGTGRCWPGVAGPPLPKPCGGSGPQPAGDGAAELRRCRHSLCNDRWWGRSRSAA